MSFHMDNIQPVQAIDICFNDMFLRRKMEENLYNTQVYADKLHIPK